MKMAKKNGGKWVWKHRYGIRKAAMAGGLFGGLMGGLGLTIAAGGAGTFIMPTVGMAGTYGGYKASRTFTKHFRPRAKKRARSPTVRQPHPKAFQIW